MVGRGDKGNGTRAAVVVEEVRRGQAEEGAESAVQGFICV